MVESVRMLGVDELADRLQALSFDAKKKGGRFALRRAANLVAKKAKANALRLDDPETGRQIAHNIAVRWNGRLFKTTGDLGFRIGVLGGAVSEKTNPDLGKGGKTFHWRFNELGTEKQEGHPFMRPALEDQTEAVVSEFIVQYGKAIDRVLARTVKGGA